MVVSNDRFLVTCMNKGLYEDKKKSNKVVVRLSFEFYGLVSVITPTSIE